MSKKPVRTGAEIVCRALEEGKSEHYRREAESLRSRLMAAERKLGAPDFETVGDDEGAANFADRALRKAPTDVDWWEMRAVRKAHGADAELRLWEGIHGTAVADLETGMRAAKVVEQSQLDKPADLARFMALRLSLVEEWKPRPGVETMLVDMLCQAQAAYELWMSRHVTMVKTPSLSEPDGMEGSLAYGGWVQTRLTDAECEQHTFGMATRWQNQILRIVRALRDLRRMSPIIVQNAGQVNVAEQQVNVATSD